MVTDYKKKFKHFLETELNSAQQKAVTHQNGPVLVIAGAGSGKTRIIIARILNLLLEHDVRSDAIVALTFTNKAAQQMKERIGNFLPQIIAKPFVGTFHSYCLQLLKQFGHYIGHDTFSILDADDQQTLLGQLIKKNNLEKRISPKNITYQISILKNNMHDALALSDPFIKQILYAYEQEKKLSKCLDFDDLLLETIKLFKQSVPAVESFKKNIKHVLVDEYQDTNRAQHELLKCICLCEKKLIIDSLCAVGDEDQSIYSWRGATVENILNFKKDFAKTAVYTIDQNYRSVTSILQTANAVIKHNTQRNPKELWSEKKATDRARIIRCLSGYQESEGFALGIKQFNKKQQSSSIAVLYRAHYQSRTIEEALIRHSIGYVIIGGIQFYERKEIKDILAYLRLIANPFDRISLNRIINCPPRGLGDKFQEQFDEVWQTQPFWNWIEVSTFIIEQNLIPAAKKNSLKQLIALVSQYSISNPPRQIVESLLTDLNYFNYLKETYDVEEATAKMDNIKELQRGIIHFEQLGLTHLQDFLAEVALLQDQSNKKNDTLPQVQLMTLHAAKGLEFDVVLLSGLDEGLFPSSRSISQPEAIEEERRLFYVGITRAREYLLLSTARYRYTFGAMTEQTSSRFLDEIPESLATRYDTSYWKETEFQQFFAHWFGSKIMADPIVTFGTSKTVEKNQRKQETEKNWKINQPVKHATFGTGIIKTIQKKDSGDMITVTFKTGSKKINAKFLEKI